MRSVFLCYLALIFSSCSVSYETKDWRIRQAGFIAMASIDWSQTNQIIESRNVNTPIGKNPSREAVANGMLSWIVLHTLISIALPDKYRDYWIGMTTSVETAVVLDNNRILSD